MRLVTFDQNGAARLGVCAGDSVVDLSKAAPELPRDLVALIPAFCAMVPAGATVTLSEEHDGSEWLRPDEAARRFCWPRERRALADALALFGTGDGGGAEDVLRVL